MMYYKRQIDYYLLQWAEKNVHKPILLRGARQVGKSTAVRHLGENFDTYIEINFEKQPIYKQVFQTDLDVKRIVTQISAISQTQIIPGKTLLFFDEIQECKEAIMSLRFFKEDMPQLHVIAAGSLLEFALKDIPTFGVGRIHSVFMYPLSFDEFLLACNEHLLLAERNKASIHNPLSQPLYEKLISLFRTYLLVGGMPDVVLTWNQTHDYLQCQEVQDDIILTYEDDFNKYAKRIDPILLRATLRSAAMQITKKFSFSEVESYKSSEVKKAIELLSLAGIIIPVVRTHANGFPLGTEGEIANSKILIIDTGLMLRLQYMSIGDISELTTHILTSEATDLVNKGAITEMFAGLELLRYQTPNIRHQLFYWAREAKNSLAEVDYIFTHNSTILPIEVKAGRQGGMKSLWIFMREKQLFDAVRCSLENYGEFDYIDTQDNDAKRHVSICPLFSISQINNLLTNK